jgi:hypothetical protein
VRDSRPSGLGMTFLVGGMLFLLLLVAGFFFLPWEQCPGCKGLGTVSIYWEDFEGSHWGNHRCCPECNGSGTLTCRKAWKLNLSPLPR